LLTVVPVLACFDDAFLARLLPARLVRAGVRAEEVACPSRVQRVMAGAVATLVAVLSVAPVSNLLSGHQVMNTSFDPLDLVNTYGAFGSVGRERDEIIFEGTNDAVPGDAADWRPYEFKCKPGDPMRRPCVISPYHYRLDWLMWFAAMSEPQAYPWTPGGRASASGRGSLRCRRAIAGSPPSSRATAGGPRRIEDQPPFVPSSRSWMSARRSTSSRWVSEAVSSSSPSERFMPARSSGSRRGSKPMSRAMRSAWCCTK